MPQIVTYIGPKFTPEKETNKPLVQITRTQKLGDLRNDVRVPHWNAIVRGEGMNVIYDFQHTYKGRRHQKLCRTYNPEKNKQERRPVMMGDHYVEFEDGTWDIMDSNTLQWYRRTYFNQHKDDAEKAAQQLEESLDSAINSVFD